MKTKLIIHPDELNKRWIDRAYENGVSVIGIHCVGNLEAHLNLARDLNLFKSESFKKNIDYAKSKGIEIEYELHAVSHLLPRDLFETHPEYFRADENGVRLKQANFCASSEDGLEVIANNALLLVKDLYGSSNNYFLWTDDLKNGYCKCEKCKNLSPSDQNLILMNSIIKKLKKESPNAKIAYLAYYDSLNVPKTVKPEEGVFLEYAPYERDLYKPAIQTLNQEEIAKIKELLKFFGKENSWVLEYWVDNSYFSGYKKPPKELKINAEEIKKDIEFYKDLGFENISSFACFLGEDYSKLYGEPNVCAFNATVNKK